MRTSVMVGIAGLFLLPLAACAGDSADTSAVQPVETTVEANTSYPVTVGDLTLKAQPQRIVSLSPTATEMLYAIGAGAQVVAVDEYSNYPVEAVALGTKLSGFDPNVEAIASFTPDLVVITYDPGNLVDQLSALSIPVFMAPAATTFESVYQQIEQLGALTGHLDAAVQVSAQMKADINAAVSGVMMPEEPLSFYHELDNTLYSVTSTTFIGQVYALFGLRNIADGVKEGNDYPQLSAEVIVAADPELIFVASGETPAAIAARDGWGGLRAVTGERIVVLPADIPSRWGPRLVQFVEVIREAVVRVLAYK